MKKGSTLFKALLVIGLGALFAHFGLSVPTKQIENVADGVSEAVQKQVSKSTQTQGQTKESQITELHEVLSVIDGDTLRVEIDGQEETIRVLGINTPETKYSSRGAECFGAEASKKANDLLINTSVSITTDSTQDTVDKYGRILAYVTMPDGRDLGQTMIADGYAYEYTHRVPYKNQLIYKEAQKQAEAEGRGLWGEGVCEG